MRDGRTGFVIKSKLNTHWSKIKLNDETICENTTGKPIANGTVTEMFIKFNK